MVFGKETSVAQYPPIYRRRPTRLPEPAVFFSYRIETRHRGCYNDVYKLAVQKEGVT